ncbi:MAG: efflux transporter outer membrane subunit [Chitinophagaceae bacterium]|nr:efflux transporter outer membrane subunit [Chitinophagaceae bacterium]MCW5905772.1 efflux transporter outer membrane subunit [Chitinophagaceae bacterium]
MRTNQHKKYCMSIKQWVILLPILLLTGCFVGKPYKAPENMINDTYYRTDKLPTDTLNIANFSWKELFTDNKLQQYIEQGLQNNLDIRNALQQINIANAYLLQGKAAFFPTLSVGPSYNFQTNSLNTIFGQLGNGARILANQYGLGINTNWEADIWGTIKNSKDIALANFLKTQSAHQAVKSNLVASIADTYYQLIALDEQKKITEQTIIYREKNLETTKALKEAGVVTAVAIKQSEALLLNSKGILISLDNSIKLLENYFCMLLSIPPQTIERNNLDQQQINTTLATGVPIQLLTNRPDVKVAEYNYMSAFYNTNVAKASFYPSLTITASTGLQSIDFSKLFSAGSLFANATASLLQPITNKRQIKTQYEVAQANQEIAFNNYKQTILTAASDVSNALFNYDAQQQLIEIKHQEFLQYDTAVQYSQQLVNNGMGNYLDVITALQNSLTAELNYINAKYGRLSNIVQLYKALGGGWK